MIFALATAVLAGAAGVGDARVAAPCTPTPVAVVPSVLRPTSGGAYAYDTDEVRTFEGASSVIHYVSGGRDAPRGGDADGDGTPDFVEQASLAADEALRFYAAPSFQGRALEPLASPPCDRAGPDERPDIYVKDISGYGLAIAPIDGEGGAFVLVDPDLEGAARQVTGGVAFTVAHELFHLVQFAYEPRGMPAWVAEGTANLFAFFWQRVDQPVLLASLDRWYSLPERSLVEPTISVCERCYGGILWWATTVANGRPVLVRMFELLHDRWRRGEPRGTGVDELVAASSEYYAAAGLAPFAPEALFYDFEAFAEGVYFVLAPKRPPLAYSIAPRAAVRTSSRQLEPLAAHYIRLVLPARARTIRIAVTGLAARPRFSVFLGVDGKGCARAIGPRFRPGTLELERAVVFTPRTSRERRSAVIAITTGSLAGGRYRIQYQAYSSSRRAVGSTRPTCGVP